MPDRDSDDQRKDPATDAPRSRIEALVHLLGDDSPRVYKAAWRHLEKIGDPAVTVLEDAASASEDSRVRIRAGKFLTERRQREVLDSWMARCARNDLDLETGALLLSRSEYPNASEEEARAELDEYARVLKRRIGSARTTEGAARKTVQFLCTELGFTGRDVDYDDPDNSYLHKVLGRKAGLPILLSTVYLCVARRVGLELLPVGMPQHFLIKYRASDGERFVDPFHDGQTLTRWDCRNFLAKNGIPFQETFLRRVGDREILSRMLGNLLRVYHAKQDQRRLNRIIVMLRALEGNEVRRKRKR